MHLFPSRAMDTTLKLPERDAKEDRCPLARASTRDKIIALVTTLAVSLLAIKLLVKDHDVLFFLAEFVHFIGIDSWRTSC